MSNQLSLRTEIKLPKGKKVEDFISGFDDFIASTKYSKDRIDIDLSQEQIEALDSDVPEVLDVDIESYGHGGHFDDRQKVLLEYLNTVTAVGGILRVIDQDMGPDNEGSIMNFPFGPTEPHRRLAQVNHALEKFSDEAGQSLDKAQFDAIRAIAHAPYAQELAEVEAYEASIKPNNTPRMA